MSLRPGDPIQLLRFLFLRGAWSYVVSESGDWIAERRARARKPDEPLGGVASALERMLAKGISVEDLTEVVRGLQYEVLFGICYLLDDPHRATLGLERELDAVGCDPLWSLCELDPSFRPVRLIGALHESALHSDPTHREMRPRKRAAKLQRRKHSRARASKNR